MAVPSFVKDKIGTGKKSLLAFLIWHTTTLIDFSILDSASRFPQRSALSRQFASGPLREFTGESLPKFNSNARHTFTLPPGVHPLFAAIPLTEIKFVCYE